MIMTVKLVVIGRTYIYIYIFIYIYNDFMIVAINPLDAGRRLTDFSQTSYAAGSRLTYKTVNQRSGS